MSQDVANTMEKYLERFTKLFWREPPKIVGECWFWTRYKNPWNGYGQVFFKDGKKTYSAKAHRLSYRIHHGPIPDGACVLHTCDNPCCYNPQHLKIGTHAENMHDRVVRNRHFSRERHPNSKITMEMASEIKTRSSNGESAAAIGASLGIHETAVRRVKNNRHWTTRHFALAAKPEDVRK